MIFQWIVGLIAILSLIIAGYSDSLSGKSKHSSYFQKVQKPSGKADRKPNIPEPSMHDSFFTKLNTLS